MVGLEGNKERNPKSSQDERLTRFSEILGAAKLNSQVDAHSSMQQSGYPDMQEGEQPDNKVAKRNNPNYTQCSFRIPKALSKAVDRAILDLDDADIVMDRSDLLEEVVGAYLRVAKQKGASDALQIFKSLGTQVDEYQA